jgi:putative FmdB family regulatory protein
MKGVAAYDYVCRICDTEFEQRRSVTDVATDVRCPNGHAEVKRRFAVFAAVGARSAAAPSGPAAGGGGCCGGACGCG